MCINLFKQSVCNPWMVVVSPSLVLWCFTTRHMFSNTSNPLHTHTMETGKTLMANHMFFLSKLHLVVVLVGLLTTAFFAMSALCGC